MQELHGFARPQIAVFRLAADDWATLRDLRLRALEDSPRAFLGDLPAERDYDDKHWRNELELNTWLMATLDERPVGLVKLNRNGHAADDIHLEALWVAEAARRRRIGEILVSAAEDVAAAAGAQQLKLWLFVHNQSARKLYLHLGYSGPHRIQPIKVIDRVTFEQEYQKVLVDLPSYSRKFAHSE